MNERTFPWGLVVRTPFGSHQTIQHRLAQLLFLMVTDRGVNRKSTLAERAGFEPARPLQPTALAARRIQPDSATAPSAKSLVLTASPLMWYVTGFEPAPSRSLVRATTPYRTYIPALSHLSYTHLVPLERFELPTRGFEGRCSVH